jgi:hypothetical protein
MDERYTYIYISTCYVTFITIPLEIQSEKMGNIMDILGFIMENMDEILVQMKTPFTGEHILVPPENQR